MKVAIVHDWLNQVGGAEAVLEALKALFPDAPVYTSMYWPAKMPDDYRAWDIRCSFMNRLPWVKTHHQAFLPLYPLAFESLDLSGYDLVVSNKSGFCHGVLTAPDALHICYCLTPTRYLWDFRSYVDREGVGRLGRAVLAPFLSYLRLWDRQAADRVDHFVSISETVRRRVEKYYRRDSVVIFPPVDVARLAPSPEHDDYFLVVSRLIPYKRIDLAVRAFNELGLPLVIVGDGRDRTRLQSMARSNVTFLGRVSADEVRLRLSRCRAFIFPGLEDFGIAPVEAIAAGRPVIAFAGGGALDTVTEGVSGTFFSPQTPEALIAAVRRFDERQYDPRRIAAQAQRFSTGVFQERFMAFVEEKLEQHRGRTRQGGECIRSVPGRGED